MSSTSSSTQLDLYVSTNLAARDAAGVDVDELMGSTCTTVARQGGSSSLLCVLPDSCLQGSGRNSQGSDTSCNRTSSISISTRTSENISSCGTVIPSAGGSPSTSLRASLECGGTSTSAAARKTGLASQRPAWQQSVRRPQAGGAAPACACWQSGACTNAPCSIPFLCLTRIQMRWLGLIANSGEDAGTSGALTAAAPAPITRGPVKRVAADVSPCARTAHAPASVFSPGAAAAAPATRRLAPGDTLQAQSQCLSPPLHLMEEGVEDVHPVGRTEASSATTSGAAPARLASTPPCDQLGPAPSPSASTPGMLHEAGEPAVSGPRRPFVFPGGILAPANSAAPGADGACNPIAAAPAATLHRVMSEDALGEELLLPVVPQLAAGGAGDRPAMATSFYSPSEAVVKAVSDGLGGASGLLCNGRPPPGRPSLLGSTSPDCVSQLPSDGTVEVKRAPRSPYTKEAALPPPAPVTPQQSYKEHDHQRYRDSVIGCDLSATAFREETALAPASTLLADGSTDSGSSEGNTSSQCGPKARRGALEGAEDIDTSGKHGRAEKHAGQKEAFKVFVLVAATDEERTTGSSSSSSLLMPSSSSSSTKQTEVTVWTLLEPDVPKQVPEPRPTSYDSESGAAGPAILSPAPPGGEASHGAALPPGICTNADAARRDPTGWLGWRVSGVAASAFEDCVGDEEDMGLNQEGCGMMLPVVPWEVATSKARPAQRTVEPAQLLPVTVGPHQRSLSPVKPAAALRDAALPPGICNAVDAIRKESSGWLGWRVSGAVAAALADEDEDADGLQDGSNIMLPLMPWAVAESKPMHGGGPTGGRKSGGGDGLASASGSSGGDDLMLPGMPWTLARSGRPLFGLKEGSRGSPQVVIQAP